MGDTRNAAVVVLPTLDEVRSVPANELDASDLAELLGVPLQAHAYARAEAFFIKYGLALYRWPQRGYLIGSPSMRIHDHDRWLSLVQDDKPHPQLYRVITEQLAPVDRMVPISSLKRLHQLLLSAEKTKPFAADGSPITSAETLVLRQSLFVTSAQSPGKTSVDMSAMVDRHNLLNHFETWITEHPEFAGMPSDLVLRMHGALNI